MNRNELIHLKTQGKRLTMVTCYDYWSARILDQTPLDMILVGDSGSMVMQGHANTLKADMDFMVALTQQVARGTHKFIVADMPFMSFRRELNESAQNAEALIRAGAQAVKLEGARGNLTLIRFLTESGIPVMGHIGLTPQFIHAFGGFRVQGREAAAAEAMLQDAKDLEAAGCMSIVLECIPHTLATNITHELKVPTIGIGAGTNCDGQVLVLHDLLGLNAEFKPKFVRQYLNGEELIKIALKNFCDDVRSGQFPNPEEAYE